MPLAIILICGIILWKVIMQSYTSSNVGEERVPLWQHR